MKHFVKSFFLFANMSLMKIIKLTFTVVLMLFAFLYLTSKTYSQTDVTDTIIDNYLTSKQSPMAGEGSHYIKWGRYFNVDPRLVVAISGAESTFGKIPCGNEFNVWGWKPEGDCWAGFEPGLDADTNQGRFQDAPGFVPGAGITMETGYEDGIFWVTENLRRFYLNQGLNTVEKIGSKWCQSGCENWASNVTQFLEDMGGDTNNLSFPDTQNPNVLNVPYFSQLDPRWKDVPLGNNAPGNGYTIGSHGCVITSISMIINYYIPDYTTPLRYNNWLKTNGFAPGDGEYPWNNKTSEYTNGVVTGDSPDDNVNWTTIDNKLSQGHPVMVKLNTNQWHYIVIKGKQNGTYYINDPSHSSRTTLDWYTSRGSSVVRMVLYDGTPPPPPTHDVGEGAPNETIRQAFIDCYNRNSGASGVGQPVSDSNGLVHLWGGYYTQDFTGGSGGRGDIIYNPNTNKAYWVHGDIFKDVYAPAGGPGSDISAPCSDEYQDSYYGTMQKFANKYVTHKSDGGAYWVI